MGEFPEFLHRKATLSDISGLLRLINGFASKGIMLPRTELEMAENIRDVAFNVPFACFLMQSFFDGIPVQLEEAAMIDGASPFQLFRMIYLPLMAPSLIAVGTYALLLAWNEYLYAFLLLSKDSDVTLAVALGHFLSADDSPWNLLMATGLVYALPPAAIYYAFRKYMVGGLTAGATKG